MQRELNPQIFGNLPKPEPKAADPVSFLPNEVKNLESQIHQLRGLLVQIEKRVEKMQTAIDESLKLTHSRMERLTQSFNRLESSHNQIQQDVQSRFSQLAGKVNERRLTETKMQDMLDRHNELVRNFENRLLHSQRVSTEQEHQLLNTHAALEEARQEINRLKRG